MALSQPRNIFGVHSITPYNINTYEPYGEARVVGSFTMTGTQELIDLFGGSSFDAWAVEHGTRSSEASLLIKEYPNWLPQIIYGVTPTTGVDASGNVTALTNIYGTSAQDASTGIASIGVKSGSETDLKFGTQYVVKVVTPTTVDVYATSDVDFTNGTYKEFEDDLLKITATPLTIPSASTVEIPGFGLELTGSAAPAMTADDTASFDVRPINSEYLEYTVGLDERPFNFGLIVAAQRRSTGELIEINCFSVLAGGAPFNLTEKAWNESEIPLKLVRTPRGLYKYRSVNASAG